MKISSIRYLVLASLLASAACGGGGSTTTGSGGAGGSSGGEVRTETGAPAAVTASGEAVTDATGRAVSVQAHAAWTQGLAKFNEYQRAGWNDDRCREVDRLFDRANDEHGGRFAEALFMRGLTKRECGTGADGRSYFESALQANPTFCQARVSLGMIQLEGGNRAEARRIFEKALEDDANCMSAYANLAMIQADAPAELEAALISLSSALALDSDFMPVFNEMAMVYYRNGTRTRDSGMLDLAHIVCEQATMISRDRSYGPIWNTWGLIRLHRGDINEALRFFRNAIQADDRIYEAHMNFANLTFQFRGYEDAERSYRRASELQPRSYDAVVGLGAALRGLSRFDDAKAAYERAIQLDANRPEAYFNLGQLYQSYMSGSVADLERARGYYQQFLQKAGTNATYAAVVTETQRQCPRTPANRRRRRGLSSCRPGYVQLIDDTITMMRAQEEMERMNRQMEQQNGATP